MATDQSTAILDQVAVSKPNEYTTASGVKFKLSRISNLIIAEAQEKIKDPVVPKVFIEAQGDQKAYFEENPNDPDYLAAKSGVQLARGIALFKMLFVLGTKPVEIPEDAYAVEDDEWIDNLEALELVEAGEIPRDPKSRIRYYYWVRNVALATPEDLQEICLKIMSLGGPVAEEKVREAIATFSSDEDGRSDSGVPITSEGESRPTDSTADSAN